MGCLLSFLLTGEHLFDGRTVMEVCGKHLHEPPRTLADCLGHEVDPRLELLVSRCVAKDPADRPSSALELEMEINKITDLGEFTAHDATEWWSEYLRAWSTGDRSALRLHLEPNRFDFPAKFDIL